jgi:hypothetical protein
MPKFIVCVVCNGEGFQSKLGAFTSSDLDEWYGDSSERDEFISEYTTRGGIYDEPCELCKGQRVITPEMEKEWDDLSEYRAECAAEQRMMGDY